MRKWPDTKGAGRGLVVDVHAHFASRRADAIGLPHRTAPDEPTLAAISGESRRRWERHIASIDERIHGELDVRLQEMDAMGVDVQIISPTALQYFYYLEPELGRQTSQMINDDLIELTAKMPDRLVPMGTVPLQQTEFAIAELERCVNVLGMRAIVISTQVNGEELSIDRLRPFFARIEELDVVLFMHPLGFTDGRRLRKHYFINSIGNPLESTIAIAHLIFDGVMDEFPNLKICVAHGGGYLAQCPGRLNRTANPEYTDHVFSQLPSEYLRRLYFDTVVYDSMEIENLVRRWGADRILLGSDWPYPMGEKNPLALLQSCSLSDSERDKVAGRNAARLFNFPGENV